MCERFVVSDVLGHDDHQQICVTGNTIEICHLPVVACFPFESGDLVQTVAFKREYYVISPEGRRLFDMQLGAKTLSVIGASDPDSISRVRELHAKHGNEWTTQWLRERGL
ncbi:hypothetical protein [uncultured Roseobacter sp.]|uniref:hypothetical protein n=1 Tax=uncultured Roseobacter sp. TaxID=114847 RepID=UPI00262CEBDC|nr:hypothetical protein [uncultured Roseobacter sp.]